MERVFESKVREGLQAPSANTDFDAMWLAIEREVSYRKSVPQGTLKPASSKRKLVPALVLSCFMFMAVPAFAGVAMNWNNIMGFVGIDNALNNGYGQRFQQSATSAGIAMNLNGVVTDGEKLKALVSFDPDEGLDRYDAYQIGSVGIADESGNTVPASSNLYFDQRSGKLLGMIESNDILQKSEKKLTITAQQLILYNYKETPLKTAFQTGDTITTGSPDYPKMHIESLTKEDDRLIVRYIVSATSPDPLRLDPHLIYGSGNGSRGELTVLPYDGEGLLIQQIFQTAEVNQNETESFRLSYLDQAETKDGKWSFTFKGDGKKASKAVYTKNLNNGEQLQEMAGIRLEKLIVSPQKITLNIEEDNSMEQYKHGVVWYNSVTLAVGDKEIQGGFDLIGSDPKRYQHAYQFESSVWYEDWSTVPMKLILGDARVTKRDTTQNWTPLKQPAELKQSLEVSVDKFLIHFTYYLDGKDLVVESWSDSPGFGGISQSMLSVNGNEVYPEMVSNGPNYTGKKVERYKGGSGFENILWNPGFYNYYDSQKNVEVKLN